MAGRELAKIDADLASVQNAALSSESAAVTLSLRDVSDSRLLRGVTFDLHAGEVLGLAGLMGAGRSELAEAIFGIHPANGEIAIAGRPFEARTPEAAQARGLALVSEDRRSDQIFPGRSVRENLTATVLGSLNIGFGVFVGGATARTRRGADAPIRHPSSGRRDADGSALGRQSAEKRDRTMVGDGPLRHHPQRAHEGHRRRGEGRNPPTDRQTRRLGFERSLISSDLPELLAISHRILVMHKGRIVGQLDRGQFDPARVVHMASTGLAA
jgi:ABC-type sugar transport system ATPase subunit